MIRGSWTLAEIPQDPLGSAGQVFAADVYSITKSKKKRSELAIATDRQGISIFDVQTSKLITSYAVSQQTVFSCAPCSNRRRGQGSGSTQRHTYCAVSSPIPQIICFSESAGIHFDPADAIVTSSKILDKHTSPIVTLDTYQVFEDDGRTSSAHKILAVHKDGKVTCYSEDLTTENWTTQISFAAEFTATAQVQYAVAVSVEQATHTLLRRREDVLAVLGTTGEESSGSLLLVVTGPTNAADADAQAPLNLDILNIEDAGSAQQEFAMSGVRKLRSLTSMPLPKPSRLLSEKSTITFHAASGKLYQNSGGILAIYDFTGLIPRLAHEIELGQGAATSYLRVSANLIAYSNSSRMSIVDLPYCSVQAERTLADVCGSDMGKDKAARLSSLKLLSYFAPSDVAIALDGRKLLAIQLSTKTPNDGGTKKRKRDGFLINAVGRGSSAMVKRPSRRGASDRKIKSLGKYLASSPATENLETQRAILDECVARGDSKGFEAAAASLLGMRAHEPSELSSKSLHHTHLDQRKIYLVLSRIFSLVVSEDKGPIEMAGVSKGLRIRLLPRKIYNWLNDQGRLTQAHVEMALEYSGALSSSLKLETGALIRTIANWDPSLEALSSLLNSAIPLSSGELVHVLATVMSESTTAPTVQNSNLLTNDAGQDNDGDVRMQITDGKTASNSSSPPPMVSHEEDRHRILATAMKKLYLIPSSSVTRALKTELSTAQLRLLVDTLRMEIARSGCLSPYEDSPEAFDTGNQDNNQICYVTHLLNCTIDSIGTGGWISGTSITDDLTDPCDTIAYMKAEISAALEGIEEATYLKGMLEGILLCGKETLRPRNDTSKFDESSVAISPLRPQTIALKEISNVLPLGLKPPPGIPTTRVAAGGELVRRSARDIGMLKSKMVGKYSFERIVI